MLGVISGIREKNNRVSFVVTLDDSDGALIEMHHGDFFGMVRKAHKIYSHIKDFNGNKCYVKFLRDDKRIIQITGIQ